MQSVQIGTIGVILSSAKLRNKSDGVKNIPAKVVEKQPDSLRLTVVLLNPDNFQPIDPDQQVIISAANFRICKYYKVLFFSKPIFKSRWQINPFFPTLIRFSCSKKSPTFYYDFWTNRTLFMIYHDRPCLWYITLALFVLTIFLKCCKFLIIFTMWPVNPVSLNMRSYVFVFM